MGWKNQIILYMMDDFGKYYVQEREWRMTVSQYTKNGEKINKDSKIKPTQEMQEVLDAFWNTVKSVADFSTPYIKVLPVENPA